MIGLRGLAAGLALAAGLLGHTGLAEAHGPSRQKATAEATLAATPDAVWAVIGNFADMSWYPGVVSTVVAADGKTRTVTFEKGSVQEELAKHDDAKRIISFRHMEDNVELIPVTNFSNMITVTDDGGKAQVKWTAGFYRGYPNNEPPPNLNDEAALAAGNAFIKTGLDALTARFGAGG